MENEVLTFSLKFERIGKSNKVGVKGIDLLPFLHGNQITFSFTILPKNLTNYSASTTFIRPSILNCTVYSSVKP